VIDLQRDLFDAAIRGEGIAVVDCWADWCQPCRGFAPIYERLARRFPDHRFYRLDTDAERDLRDALQVAQIPTILLYRDGILLFRSTGTMTEEALANVIEQAAALDMQRVRAELAADAAGEASEA
jgi:thioredoxin 1